MGTATRPRRRAQHRRRTASCKLQQGESRSSTQAQLQRWLFLLVDVDVASDTAYSGGSSPTAGPCCRAAWTRSITGTGRATRPPRRQGTQQLRRTASCKLQQGEVGRVNTPCRNRNSGYHHIHMEAEAEKRSISTRSQLRRWLLVDVASDTAYSGGPAPTAGPRRRAAWTWSATEERRREKKMKT